MRVVHNEAALLKAIHVTQTEAKAFFGDGTVYLEKFLENPRHVEIYRFLRAQTQRPRLEQFQEMMAELMGGESVMEMVAGMSPAEIKMMPPFPFPKELFPPGTFHTGSLSLPSHTTLQLAAGEPHVLSGTDGAPWAAGVGRQAEISVTFELPQPTSSATGGCCP